MRRLNVRLRQTPGHYGNGESLYAKAHGITTPKIPAAPQLSNRIIEFVVAAALRMKLRCATA
jgi:hypothetical protein